MTIDRNIKVGVIASIIATIIFIYLLDPIMRLFGFFLFDLGSSIFRAYIDRLFEQAALMVAPDPAFYLYMCFLLFIGFAMISTTVLIFVKNNTNKPEEISESRKARRKLLLLWIPWINFILTLLVCVFLLTSLNSTLFQLRIVSSFNQHLTAISPYISQQEINILRSQWTQMRSEDDYKIIYSQLNSIAKQNHVRLPENLVFSSKNYF